MIFDRHRYLVGHSLIHGVSVYLVAKGLVGFRNGRARETNKRRIRQSFTQHFCVWFRNHCPHVLVSIFAELNALRAFNLRSMSFITETDDIVALIDESYWVILAVAEFLYGTDEETATVSERQFLPQYFSAWHNRHFAQAQKLGTFSKEFCSLLLKVFTVNNHQNRWRAYLCCAT